MEGPGRSEHVGPNGGAIVHHLEDALQAVLVLQNVEVIGPELHEALMELTLAHHRTQNGRGAMFTQQTSGGVSGRVLGIPEVLGGEA